MSDEELRKRLLNQDEASSPARAGGPPSSDAERKEIADVATLAKVRAERSKRRMIGAWLLTLALVIGGTVAEAVLRAGPATASSGTRSPALTAVAVATRVAFIVAMASTVAYIIRSRGATLAEMNRRLARLEDLVEGMARAKRD
jgi:hypothetical protein